MLKGPKYKRGFTLRHHLDEWWDRRPHEWKVRLMVSVVLAVVVGGLALLFWGHRWMEREELITQARAAHLKRVQTADREMASSPPVQSPPIMAPSASLELRPGE